VADANASADVSEVHVHLVSQHWPMAAPTHLPVPMPSHDLLLSLYGVCALYVHDLIILILFAPAYIANPISVPTHTIPSKSQALLVVNR